MYTLITNTDYSLDTALKCIFDFKPYHHMPLFLKYDQRARGQLLAIRQPARTPHATLRLPQSRSAEPERRFVARLGTRVHAHRIVSHRLVVLVTSESRGGCIGRLL